MAARTKIAGPILPPTREPAVSRQALRTKRTRADLLRAARTIFARDGFEASRIEDIATEAGRSRGAFYANFDNKTEMFLALRSLTVLRRVRELKRRLAQVESDRAYLPAVQGYMVEQICDSETLLLQIEFKLFALRHPEMLRELSTKHLEASTSINRQELPQLFPPKSKALAKIERNTLAVEALLEGFTLNALFSPRVMNRKCVEDLVPKLLALVLPPH